jgi:Class II Aldolase and Adducin N-terminal domain
MNRHEQEGVIKFDLDFKPAPFPATRDLRTLIAWRAILHRLRLIGQDPLRYGGLGFGNISQKILEFPIGADGTHPMIISGTQTGAMEWLNATQFCMVTAASIRHNRIVAQGPVKPSSEALTHIAVYRCHPEIRFVMHVHSPEIWRATQILGIPWTAETIAYGTPAMAIAVHDLIQSQGSPPTGIFSMLGHEDGIVSYGITAESAGNALIDTLARALALAQATRPDCGKF